MSSEEEIAEVVEGTSESRVCSRCQPLIDDLSGSPYHVDVSYEPFPYSFIISHLCFGVCFNRVFQVSDCFEFNSISFVFFDNVIMQLSTDRGYSCNRLKCFFANFAFR